MRAFPSAVLGPLDKPPCKGQRQTPHFVLRAGALQRRPRTQKPRNVRGYRFTCIGTGGANWLRTVTPDVAGVSADPLDVVGTVEGPAGVAAPCLVGAVAGATVDGVGAVAGWLEQAVQSPNKITIAAFLIVASIR